MSSSLLTLDSMMHGTIECPSRQQVAMWVLNASCSVSHQTGCEWFPKDMGTDRKWYKRVWDDDEEDEIEIPMAAC